VQGCEILAVLHLQHAPAHGLEAGRHILAPGELGFAFDGDVVVVPEHGQLFETQVAREAGGFVGDPLHQAAVPGEGIGAVIHDSVAGTVEAGGHPALGDGHAHGVADALAQGPGGRLDACGVAELWVAGRL